MTIELRLKSLEAKKASKKGVFVVWVWDDGLAHTRINGEDRTFNDIDEAIATLNAMYDDPLVITWGRSETENDCD